MSHYIEFIDVAQRKAGLHLDRLKAGRIEPYIAKEESTLSEKDLSTLYSKAVINLARSRHMGTAPTLEELTLLVLEGIYNSRGQHFTSADRAHWVNILSRV